MIFPPSPDFTSDCTSENGSLFTAGQVVVSATKIFPPEDFLTARSGQILQSNGFSSAERTQPFPSPKTDRQPPRQDCQFCSRLKGQRCTNFFLQGGNAQTEIFSQDVPLSPGQKAEFPTDSGGGTSSRNGMTRSQIFLRFLKAWSLLRFTVKFVQNDVGLVRKFCLAKSLNSHVLLAVQVQKIF